ncbi:DUF4435 domain-containing protein [Cronbergia sp. UHCC 0137]|uniref:DUF4435 domain-containing protein n=1 Tax=Cronbergia sp. UHCC 0137 TaxID=3110239 RepID=UPI002B1F1A55|nr:DUF4435 domain-containing protein [Cronbergia sp. UHCC 0137]MEA5617177.1 DUF4435 domain-containing protein [Cronbergia sp. UHCC 0137]
MNADDLRRARESTNVPYQEFNNLVSKDKNGLFCFFEGKDNPYYYSRIKKLTTLNIQPIICNRRKSVLKVYELINYHREYDKYKKAFFIDRDFNEPLPPHNPPIFETPCYSIENFYVSLDVFKEIIKNEFNLSEASETYESCIILFTERQKEFHEATILFNAWYACLIKIRNITGKETGVDLNDKFPNKFIDLTLQSISAKYDFEKIKQTFPKALEVSEDILNTKLAEFTNCDQCKVFRGKYEMQFILKMIELILQDSSNDQKYIQQKIKFIFGKNLTNNQAISIFSAYAETPESLNHYITQVSS